jgi:hypothetical protein
MNRIQGERSGPPVPSAQTGQEWARLLSPSTLEAGPWAPLKPAGRVPHGRLRADVDRNLRSGSAPAEASLWDGVVPEPLDPGDAD